MGEQKNKSIINSLNLKFRTYQLELSNTQEKYNNLKIQHSKLIQDSIQIERDKDKLEVAISNMCFRCVEKAGELCQNGCALYDVATEFNLWED